MFDDVRHRFYVDYTALPIDLGNRQKWQVLETRTDVVTRGRLRILVFRYLVKEL